MHVGRVLVGDAADRLRPAIAHALRGRQVGGAAQAGRRARRQHVGAGRHAHVQAGLRDLCMIGIGARTYDFMKSASIALALAISRSAISGVRSVRAKL